SHCTSLRMRNEPTCSVRSGDLTQSGGISQFVDQICDEAFNETMIANDLPDLRWGRIDYLNDRGQSLRFFRPQYLRIRDGGLREFLKQELYLHALPWDTAYSPGGSREYLMHYFALTLTKIYNITVLVPRWLLYILSGSVASFIIQIMHKPQPPKPSAVQQYITDYDNPEQGWFSEAEEGEEIGVLLKCIRSMFVGSQCGIRTGKFIEYGHKIHLFSKLHTVPAFLGFMDPFCEPSSDNNW
ncbi:hypothetical protein MPER_05092, partial [Moniliophthora perniciosa FA553]